MENGSSGVTGVVEHVTVFVVLIDSVTSADLLLEKLDSDNDVLSGVSVVSEFGVDGSSPNPLRNFEGVVNFGVGMKDLEAEEEEEPPSLSHGIVGVFNASFPTIDGCEEVPPDNACDTEKVMVQGKVVSFVLRCYYLVDVPILMIILF